jgi:AhpD family alkylhydroperoxidase
MRQKLVKLVIEAAARRNGGDSSYMVALYAASPRVLRRLKSAVDMLSHREAIPVEAAYAAQLTGALAEGCGSCVQIHINMARDAAMGDEQIEAILLGDETALSVNVALAMRFARAISSRSPDEHAARECVRARWGDKGVVDVTMATQASRFLSMLKFGFGFATTCDSLLVGGRVVNPTNAAA